jgi:hypothetical protein
MQAVRTPRVLVATAVLLITETASATPRPLPFTYNYETLGEGELEVEQFADLTPVKVIPASGNSLGEFVLASQFQTEFEYGITNHLELGLYLTLAPSPPGGNFPTTPVLTEGNGVKERLRYRLFDEGVLPIDVGLYGELTENDHEFEIEAKIILQKRIRNLRIAANIVGEHEWYYASPQQDWIFDPSAGITYEVTPVFQPGIDSWMWLEHTNSYGYVPVAGTPTPLNLRPNVYVGPAILLNFGKFWWSTGAYLRVTNIGYQMVATQSGGDSFGAVWFRMMVGISF